MKRILFVCHDPGGYDVVSPVYNALSIEQPGCIFLPVGPSKSLAGYGVDNTELLQILLEMLEKKGLDMLVTGTSWGTDIEVKCINLCKLYGVTTVSILDYWSNYRMRFRCGNSDEYIFPTRLFVMDEIAYKESIADGIDKDILEVTGSPGLDKYVLLMESREGEATKKIGDILFLSAPMLELYGDSLGYTEQSAFEEVLEVCDALGRDVRIKLHPKDNDAMRNRYSYLEVGGTIEDVVPGFNVVIGMATMGLLHTYLLGVPIISYEPGLIGNDMCITNKLEITKRIDNRIELKHRIININRQPAIHKGLLWEDGKSTERVLYRICSLIKQ